MKAVFLAALLSGAAITAGAAPTDWTLTYDDGSPLGTLAIDFATGAISGSASGQYGTYTNLAFGSLNTPDQVAGTPVLDFFKFLDPASGTTWFTDHGNGESQSLKLNEAAIEIGTMLAALSPLGGRFQVIVRELLNYDETFTTCSVYEDLYDPATGEYLGPGACLYTNTTHNFNIGTEDVYTGWLTYTPPVAAVPLPAGGLLLAGGVAVLAVAARRRRPG